MKLVAFTELRPDELADPLEAIPAETRIVSVASRDGLLSRLFTATREGRQAIEEQSPDAIVVYNGAGPLGLLCVLLSLRYSVPLIVRLNGDIRRQHREKVSEYRTDGNWVMWAQYRLYAALTAFTFSRASGFVPVSRELKEIVRRQTTCPPDRIQVVHGPIQSHEYRKEPDRTLHELGVRADHVLLTVTNLDFRGKYRGVRRVLEDVVPLLERREDVAYVIAGDGRYRDRLVAELDRLEDESVKRRIHVPGYVDDVAELYAGADAFVYVSYIDGYPNVVLEAQAAGLPVVANRAHGMPEQITDDVTGILIDPDRDELRPVLEALLDDEEWRRELGRRASDKIDNRNRPERIGRELYAAIDRIIEAERASQRRNRRKR